MSLKPLQAQMPLGQFDMLDTHISYVKGGEVACFVSVTATTATDKAAYDVFDGYITPANRAAASLLPVTGVKPPYMLTDDGITGYGTLFGTVVGGTVGQVSSGGAVLGPHTATGSGKVTLWAAPGLFAISLDAVTAALQPSAGVSAGAALYGTATDTVASSAGQLTTSSAGSNKLVGNFVEYVTNGSLVTTPNTLAGTFNPPDGTLTTTAKVPTFLVMWFNPASA